MILSDKTSSSRDFLQSVIRSVYIRTREELNYSLKSRRLQLVLSEETLKAKEDVGSLFAMLSTSRLTITSMTFTASVLDLDVLSPLLDTHFEVNVEQVVFARQAGLVTKAGLQLITDVIPVDRTFGIRFDHSHVELDALILIRALLRTRRLSGLIVRNVEVFATQTPTLTEAMLDSGITTVSFGFPLADPMQAASFLNIAAILPQCTSLRNLHLGGTKDPRMCIFRLCVSLQNSPHLRQLQLTNLIMYGDSIQEIARVLPCTRLEHLELGILQERNRTALVALITATRDCPTLRTFCVTGTDINVANCLMDIKQRLNTHPRLDDVRVSSFGKSEKLSEEQQSERWFREQRSKRRLDRFAYSDPPKDDEGYLDFEKMHGSQANVRDLFEAWLAHRRLPEVQSLVYLRCVLREKVLRRVFAFLTSA